MVKFKNMKILVENNLAEIVGELERLGYVKADWFDQGDTELCITAYQTGRFKIRDADIFDCYGGVATTLTELRSMNIETLKEM